MTKLGYCRHCRTLHQVETSGAGCGTLCTVALVVVRKHPVIAVGLFVAGLLWGDQIEAWFTARCPACRTALRLVAAGYR